MYQIAKKKKPYKTGVIFFVLNKVEILWTLSLKIWQLCLKVDYFPCKFRNLVKSLFPVSVNAKLRQIPRVLYSAQCANMVLPLSTVYLTKHTACISVISQGYQIPKGWTVMYSIRDTHETAEIFKNPELFDPERFVTAQAENRSSRFSYVPFGGGVRSCVGKELAQIILKTLTIELIRTCKWTLATEKFPKMQTVPIVHPVNGLHVNFMYKKMH